MKTKRIEPVHPGESLLHDFMEPLNLSQYALAKAIGVTPMRVSQIVRGQRAVTADTALRLSRYFGTRPAWWMDWAKISSASAFSRSRQQSRHALAVFADVVAMAAPGEALVGAHAAAQTAIVTHKLDVDSCQTSAKVNKIEDEAVPAPFPGTVCA